MQEKQLFAIWSQDKLKILGFDNNNNVTLGAIAKVKPIIYHSKFAAKQALKLMSLTEEVVVL